MAKPGEQIVIVPPLIEDENEIVAIDSTSSWDKWIRLIFN
jgi:hypothetical protein